MAKRPTAPTVDNWIDTTPQDEWVDSTAELSAIPHAPATIKPPVPFREQVESKASELVGNIPSSAETAATNYWNTAKDFLGMAKFAISPYRGTSLAPIPEIPKALGNLALGTAENLVPFWNPDTPESRMAGAMGQSIANAVRHPVDTLGNYIVKHPVEALLDASSLFTGGGALMQKTSSLAKAGQVVSKIGAATDPIQLGLKTGLALRGRGSRWAAAPLAESGALRLYQRSLDPSVSGEKALERTARITKAGLEEGIPLTIKPSIIGGKADYERPVVTQMAREIRKQADFHIKNIVSELQQQGLSATKRDLADAAYNYLAKEYLNSPQTVDKITQLAEARIKFMNEPPYAGLDPTTGMPRWSGVPKPTMGPEEMQAMKKRIYLEQEQKYQKAGPHIEAKSVEDEFNMSVAHQLMDRLEQWNPDLKLLNRKSGDYKLLEEEFKKFVAKRRSKPAREGTQWAWAGGRVLGGGAVGAYLGGVQGGALGVLMALAVGHPRVKGRLAIALDRASKLAEATGGAMLKAAPISVPITPATQILNRLQPIPEPPPSLQQR